MRQTLSGCMSAASSLWLHIGLNRSASLARGCSSVAEHMLSMHGVPGSIPGISKLLLYFFRICFYIECHNLEYISVEISIVC